MCQAFAGFDGRLWEANLTFCVVLGYRCVRAGCVAVCAGPDCVGLSSLDVSHLTILSITARDDIDESRRHTGLLLAAGGGQKECSYRAKLVRKDGSTMVCSIELVVLEVEGQPYVKALPSLYFCDTLAGTASCSPLIRPAPPSSLPRPEYMNLKFRISGSILCI